MVFIVDYQKLFISVFKLNVLVASRLHIVVFTCLHAVGILAISKSAQVFLDEHSQEQGNHSNANHDKYGPPDPVLLPVQKYVVGDGHPVLVRRFDIH